MIRSNLGMGCVLAAALAASMAASAADLDPRVPPLQQRLDVLANDPRYVDLAGVQLLQARQAVDALAAAKKRDRDLAAYVADRRVEIAETTARAQAADREAQALRLAQGEGAAIAVAAGKAGHAAALGHLPHFNNRRADAHGPFQPKPGALASHVVPLKGLPP